MVSSTTTPKIEIAMLTPFGLPASSRRTSTIQAVPPITGPQIDRTPPTIVKKTMVSENSSPKSGRWPPVGTVSSQCPYSAPAKPAIAPESAKAISLYFATLMPHAWAASSLSRTA
jgi:hypothetical protein